MDRKEILERAGREPIRWERFESKYFTPEPGREYELMLANWGMKLKSFDDGKTEKLVIEADVLKIDGEEFPIGEKVFVTSAQSFAREFRPIAEDAERRGKLGVLVSLTYGKDKRYRVIDVGKYRGLY